jgi:hypothetical protein
MPWRRDIVVITYAYITEDPWFESRQCVKYLVLYLYIAMLLSKFNMHCNCISVRKTNTTKREFITRYTTGTYT